MAGSSVTVTVDVSQAPELEEWCSKAKAELVAWYPRIRNLLASEGFTPPGKVELTVKKSEKGIGGTAGGIIVIYSDWVLKHPEDTGMVIHELTHIIQNYPSPDPWWVTEGIADYIRWAIYDGKPLAWFPVPQKPSGYTEGYRTAAGFLLWLESGPAFGIVRILNKAMREGTYSDSLFKECAGKPLPDLWKQYREARKKTGHPDRAVPQESAPGAAR
jgi:hypothetical protein